MQTDFTHSEAASKAEVAAAEGAPQAPTSRPVARRVGGPAWSKPVPLTWPVEFEGRVYDSITVRRMSTAELGAFIDAAGDDTATARLPMLDDDAGQPIPEEVLAAIDPDDTARVDAAVADFLPRALRSDPETASRRLPGGSAPA